VAAVLPGRRTRTRTVVTRGCCRDASTGAVRAEGSRTGASRGPGDGRTVALVGAPNVGKSTLFNALTGARRSVGNWPGTTVEVGRGSWRLPDGERVTVLDLPGAVSLDPVSPDEELTRDLVAPAVDRPAPSDGVRGRVPGAVVLVVDAADLGRGLYLVRQVRELPQRVVLALSMMDVARRRGRAVDVAALSAAVGVPVVPVDPRRRDGLARLGEAVTDALDSAAPVPLPPPQPLPGTGGPAGEPVDEPVAVAEQIDELGVAEARFAWVADVVAASTRQCGEAGRGRADRIDRLLTSPVIGPLVFLAVMWGVFQVTTRLAAPVQEWLSTALAGPVDDGAREAVGAFGLRGSLVEGLLVDGLVAGVGTVLTFVPVMAVMFLTLAVLEDSGYLARAAVVTDRLMRSVGLPGRAFLPLVVGFGCNVPAVSATRVLPDARHRLLTTLLVPLTSCSARLTVYVLVATAVFGDAAGNVVFGLYVLSVLLVVGVGLLLRSTLLRVVGDEPLVIDLPRFQAPAPRILLSVTWGRLADFLRTAGGVIVLAVTAVWLLSAVPAPGSSGEDRTVTAGGAAATSTGSPGSGSTGVEGSAYHALASASAPVFEPAGFGDWHLTGTLLVGFVAKEAVVSSWAQTYSVQEEAAGQGAAGGALGERLRADLDRSSGGHPVPAALAFLAFFLAYTPCAATLAAQRREIGGRWTAVGVGVQLGVAWLLAVVVFQVGRLVA